MTTKSRQQLHQEKFIRRNGIYFNPGCPADMARVAKIDSFGKGKFTEAVKSWLDSLPTNGSN